MTSFGLVCRRTTASSLVLALAFACGSTPLRAATTASAPVSVEFDEIDHVYTTGKVPTPGSFRLDQSRVVEAPSPAPARGPARTGAVLDALGRAGTVVGGAASVVAASGEIGRVLRLTDDAAKLVPVASAMGMAGSRKFDTLLQTYVLPRVSPTGAVMLAGFLSAQAEYKRNFPPAARPAAAQAAPPAQTPPPAQLEPYARGALRHYVIGANGWVRIDDPNTKLTVIIKPDAGKTYLLDAAAKTVRTVDYGPPRAEAASASAGGTAVVTERAEPIDPGSFDGVAGIGFRTRSTLRVAAAGGACPDTVVTSTRVEYFSRYRIASEAANASPAAPGDPSGCRPATTVNRAGAKVPADQLLVYQANTIEKKTASGTEQYTVVIERGNLQERTTADTAPFEIPGDYRQL